MPAEVMQSLRALLRASSARISSVSPSSPHSRRSVPSDALPSPAPSRLAALSARWQLLLTFSGTLHTLRAGAAGDALRLSAPLPAGATGLVASRSASRAAVVGARGVAVASVDVAAGSADVISVGAPLFRTRPGLTVVQVAWHPRAEDYLLVLTSDGSLRLFDVAGAADVEAERTRLRIVTTGDMPVSFAFGKGEGWNGLAVYVLTESGAVYVASPVAPLGTRLSRQQWSTMVSEAEAVLDQQGVGRGPVSGSASLSLTVGRTSRRPGSNVILEETSVPMGSSNDLGQGTFVSGPASASGLAKSENSVGSSARRALGGKPQSITPRRQLHFGGLDDDDKEGAPETEGAGGSFSNGDGATVASQVLRGRGMPASGKHEEEALSWSVRQARLQLRFLERAFQKAVSGDMLLVREFKPAPLLFQGPLFIERDDLDHQKSTDSSFTSITVLDTGSHVPPIFLRARSDGNVSVLLGMEAVEGQWFVSEDRFGTTGDCVLAASKEYAKVASVVAPSLLCFERLEFPVHEPVSLCAVRGRSDIDMVFARTNSVIYSVRLSFVSAMRAPDTLRGCKSSLITPLLSVNQVNQPGTLIGTSSSTIVGLAPFFEKDCGPLAIALTSNGTLEATAPLRWMAAEQGDAFPESLVCAGVTEKMPIVAGPMLSGEQDVGLSEVDLLIKNQKALKGSGLEVAETLQAVRQARSIHGWAVAAGSLGTVSDAASVTDVLACLETRVMAYTGDDDGGRRGVGDELKALGMILPKWAGEVLSRARRADGGIALVEGEMEARTIESAALAVKLRRVQEMNQNLCDRVDCLREIHDSRQAVLSHAEVARLAKLKERRRHVASMRRKIEEVTLAISALTAASEDAAARQRLSVGGSFRTPGIGNAIGRLSISPLASRRGSKHYQPGYSDGNNRGMDDGGGHEDLGSAQLQRIKETLAEQSRSIQAATEKTNALWKQFEHV